MGDRRRKEQDALDLDREPSAFTRHKYAAFLSYSQRDEKVARWFHRALETYRLPKSVSAPRKRVAPIFRDKDELAPAMSLSREIEGALEASAGLVILCSTRSASSSWVDDEVRYFTRLPDARPIVCCLIDDAYPKNLPPSLTTTSDILAVNATKHGDGRAVAKLKIVAALLGIDYDVLRRRDLRRRRQRQSTIAATLAVLAVLVLVVGLRQRHERKRLNDVALSQQLAATSTREAQSNPAHALELAIDSLAAASTPEGAIAVRNAIDANWEGLELVSDSAFLDVATSDQRVVSRHADGSVRLWDLEHRTVSTLAQGHARPDDVAIGADLSWVAVGSSSVIEVHSSGGTLPLAVPTGEHASGIVVSRSGDRLAAWTDADHVTVWDAKVGTPLARGAANGGRPIAVTGSGILWGADSDGLIAWQSHDGLLERRTIDCKLPSPPAWSVRMSADSKKLLALCAKSAADSPTKSALELVEFDVDTMAAELRRDAGGSTQLLAASSDGSRALLQEGTKVREISLDLGDVWSHDAAIADARYTDGDSTVTIAIKDGPIELLDASNGQTLKTVSQRVAAEKLFVGDQRLVLAQEARRENVLRVIAGLTLEGARFGHHTRGANLVRGVVIDEHVITAGAEGLVVVWGLKSRGQVPETAFDLGGPIESIVQSGQYVAATSGTGSVLILDTKDLHVVLGGDVGQSVPAYVAFSSQGMVVGAGHTILGYDFTGHPVWRNHVDAMVGGVASSAAADRVALVVPNSESLLLDARSGERVASLSSEDRLAAMDSTGRCVTARHSTVSVWDKNGHLLCTFAGHHSPITGIVFTTDKLVASASEDGAVRAWTADSCKEKWSWQDTAAIEMLVGSPDGHSLAASNAQGWIHVFDPLTGVETTASRRHKDQVFDLAFSSDSRMLSSGGMDGWLRIQLLDSRELVRAAQRVQPARILSASRPADARGQSLAGKYELDRRAVASSLVDKELQRDPTLSARRAELETWATQRATEVSMSLDLDSNGWFSMHSEIQRATEAIGTWTSHDNTVELVDVERDGKYDANNTRETLTYRDDGFVMGDGFRLVRTR